MNMTLLSSEKKSEPALKPAAPSRASTRGLKIGEPHDAFEQEADRVADEVMAGGIKLDWSLSKMNIGTPLQRKCSCGGSGGSAGECEECKKTETLQRRAVGPATPSVAPPIVHEVLNSPGKPLGQGTRNFFEPRFRHDFSTVRIHTDSRAQQSADSVNAVAYTVGNHIVFGRGRYSPSAVAGQRLLAHELTHTIQQRPVLSRQTRDEYEPGPMFGPTLNTARAIPEPDEPDDGGFFNGVNVLVRRGGQTVFVAPAFSGHTGSSESEVNVGPIPDGKYFISPHITRPPVKNLQTGICAAAGIQSGYQELTSTDQSPCDSPNPHCTVSCPTTANPAQTCFTPVGCWGSKRIRIEGSATVTTKVGKKVVRDGFYIHGGDHSINVTSGCVKTFDGGLFNELRKFKKRVPFWVTKVVKSAPPATSSP